MIYLNPKKELEKLFALMPERKKEQREKDVLFSRLGINNNGKESLQSIGNKYHITRERIRQIQNQGIKNLRKASQDNPEIFNFINQKIKNLGGILSLPTANELFLNPKNQEKEDQKYLHLLLIANPKTKYYKNTSKTAAYFTHKVKKSKVNDLYKKIEKYFKNKKQGENIKELAKILKIDQKTIKEVSLIFNKLGLKDEKIGFSKFKDINPKTAESKIDYIFEKYKKPLHFSQIADLIKKEDLSKKNPTTPTIHNELIKHTDKYILIGRGTYGLAKWGYKPGTVKELAQDIIKNSIKKLSRDELIKEILKQRQVKRNTIILNLSALKKELK